MTYHKFSYQQAIWVIVPLQGCLLVERTVVSKIARLLEIPQQKEKLNAMVSFQDTNYFGFIGIEKRCNIPWFFVAQ